LLGDAIHNFTDGLTIGVSFIANYRLGMTTTVAMFFHEIPHEVGDFALLYSLNYGLWSILGVQLLTSLGAMAGCVVGSYLGTLYMKECLAFTSGGFLYFAINGLLGELKSVKTISELTNCILAMCLGLYFMYLFALFE
jgi:zinc and cadmium transporter